MTGHHSTRWRRRRRSGSLALLFFLLLYLPDEEAATAALAARTATAGILTVLSTASSATATSLPENLFLSRAERSHSISDRVFRVMTGVDRHQLLRVCYGKFGCFSLDHPWVSLRRVINMAPKSPRAIWPNFFLYTRGGGGPSPAMDVLVDGDLGRLRRSNFDPDRMTFVITHGYMEHGKKNWLQEMMSELLRNGDHNVIIVDWLTGSRPPYTQAVANIRLIGVQTAHFLAFLAHDGGLDLMKVHMVGHSLGAHLAGYVGECLQREWFITLGRITGLDPAEPHFEWTDPVVRLDPSDAFFVDVIHTDAGPLMSAGAGVYQPCGHLDFYPNGGVMMKGCDRTIVGSLKQEDGNMAFAFRRLIGCNHFRAYEYFIESINSDCPFTGVECESYEAFANGQCDGCLMGEEFRGCEFMGFKAFSTLNGSRPDREFRQLFLLTEAEKPFCSWPYRVTIVLSDTRLSMRQRGDRGDFYMILHGEKGSTSKLLLNPRTAYFESGRVYNFVTTTRGVGHVHAADLIWEFAFHPLNPLTWRVFSASKMFVNRVEIEKFGGGKRHVFCAQDRAFFPGRPQRVIWRPHCRENRPDPGASFLGTVLNSDPIGGAEMVLHQVNPLAMNPLNGLANIGAAFNTITSSVQSMGAAVRRVGTQMRRAFVVENGED